MEVAASLAGLLAAFFLLRLGPVWHRRHQGCDAYYFLMASEALRRSRRLPIVLPPVYLLEPQEQWYPPGFTILLALLPRRFVERCYWVLTNAIDSVIAAALFLWLWEAHGPGAAWVGGLAYSASALFDEYGTLTSRSLASLLTALLLVASYLWTDAGGGAWALAGAITAGYALLHTHKLSVQLLWFLIPFLAVIERDVAWFVPLAASYVAALAIGRGQFVNILRAHWDIVSFWQRNWRHLGAHAVDESPIYGDSEAGTGFYGSAGPKTLRLQVRRLLQFNPAAIALPVVVLANGSLDQFEVFLWHCVVGIYLWSALTLIVDPLKCLGEGTKYIKFAIPPSLALVAGPLVEAGDALTLAILGTVLGAQCVLYFLVARRSRAVAVVQSGVLTPALSALLSRTATLGNIRLMCLPSHLADLAAYRTGAPVLWGTHGYGFKRAEAFFPIMRRPVEHFVERYRLTHLLLDRRYTNLVRLRLVEAAPVYEAGEIALFAFDDILPASGARL